MLHDARANVTGELRGRELPDEISPRRAHRSWT
jgi:hypothetical protein